MGRKKKTLEDKIETTKIIAQVTGEEGKRKDVVVGIRADDKEIEIDLGEQKIWIPISELKLRGVKIESTN